MRSLAAARAACVALLCAICVSAQAADPLAPRWPERSGSKELDGAGATLIKRPKIVEMILRSDGRWSARVGGQWMSVGDKAGAARIVGMSRFKVTLSNGASVSLGQEWPNEKRIGK